MLEKHVFRRLGNPLSLSGLCIVVLGALLLVNSSVSGIVLEDPQVARAAPELTQASESDWIGSPPLTLAGLRGQVVLLNFWSFTCWNCTQSLPWLNSLEKRFAGKPFALIGVHTPNHESAHSKKTLLEKIEEYGITHPVMIDNERAYWEAMGNRYWPTFYLVDKAGKIRSVFLGETHAGDKQSALVEASIERLLTEDA